MQVVEKAKKENKYVLVNIQDVSEFDCQRLNRDTWSDLELQRLVSQNFKFWQGGPHLTLMYCNFHPIDAYPHIAALDPITGQRMWYWEGWIGPQDLYDKCISISNMKLIYFSKSIP